MKLGYALALALLCATAARADTPFGVFDQPVTGTMATSGATVSELIAGADQGTVTLSGTFSGTLNLQCVPTAGSAYNLQTLQSNAWVTTAFSAVGVYFFKGAQGCPQLQTVFTSYTSGSATVTINASYATTTNFCVQPRGDQLLMTEVQTVTPQDRSATGTINAINGTVSTVTNGASTCLADTLGTWSGTLIFECESPSTTWYQLLGLIPNGATTGSLSGVNDAVLFNVGGCSAFRLRAFAWTSGTATININCSSGLNALQVFNTIAGNFLAKTWTQDGAGNAITSTTHGAKQSLDANTKGPLTANSPTSVSVGVASTAFLAANASRKGMCAVNVSSSTISFGMGTAAVLNSGITLYPGGTWCMDEYTYSQQAINAIASAAASTVAAQELQ